MARKFIVVGGVAGGASAAARIRRIDENADIQIYDKGYDISFSNCSLPNYFSGEIKSPEDIVFYNPESFKKTYNLSAKTRHEVTKILADEHKVVVKNLETGEEFEDDYEALILSPGAQAIKPRAIKGIDKDHVFTMKTVEDVRRIDALIKEKNADQILVVGGGFIGVEAAENFAIAGKKVSLVEGSTQILNTLDHDMVQMLHKELYDNGINLVVNQQVTEITDDAVILSNGDSIPAQIVIMAIGVRPDVAFAVESGIELGETGCIKVNHHYETNLKDVYAIGDAIEVSHFITKQKMNLALAGPAQRQARNVADHLYGKPTSNRGVIGSQSIRVFDLNAASTGMTERDCQKANIDYRVSFVIPNDHVSLIPTAYPMHFKVVYEYPTGQILGAQAISKADVVGLINTMAAVISYHGDLMDLKDMEFAYSPSYSTPKNAINFAGIVGLNYLNGEYEQVPVSAVRQLVEEKATIIDVRPPAAFEKGHIKGAINIPLSQIRDRVNEIPKDGPVYIHCRTSWNSYYALSALKGFGYNNVINIQGSFLGLSYYEYFTDQTTDREPIVTDYNFN